MRPSPSNTAAIVPYTGTPSRASRVSGSNHTATIRKRVQHQFGVDVGQFGNLTPEMVRNMSISAQVAKEQLEMLNVYIAAAKERGMVEAEIEKMRADFLKDADRTLKGLDKTFQGAVLLNARHEQHMRQIEAETAGSLQEIRQDGDQALNSYQRQLADRLKAMRQIHGFEIKSNSMEIAADARNQIQQMRDRPMQIQQSKSERRDFFSFITGKPKAVLPASKKNFGGWFN